MYIKGIIDEGCECCGFTFLYEVYNNEDRLLCVFDFEWDAIAYINNNK